MILWNFDLLWKNFGTIPKIIEKTAYYTKTMEKTLALYQTLWNFDLLRKKLWYNGEKIWYYTENYKTLMVLWKKKTKLLWNTLWYFNKLLLTIWTIVYYSNFISSILHGFPSAMDTRLLSLYKVTAEANMHRVNTYIINYTFYIMIF